MFEWTCVAVGFPGWSLTEIKDLPPRERKNWVEIAKGMGKLGTGSK